MRAYMSIQVEMKAIVVYSDQRNPNPLSRLDKSSLEKNILGVQRVGARGKLVAGKIYRRINKARATKAFEVDMINAMESP